MCGWAGEDSAICVGYLNDKPQYDIKGLRALIEGLLPEDRNSSIQKLDLSGENYQSRDFVDQRRVVFPSTVAWASCFVCFRPQLIVLWIYRLSDKSVPPPQTFTFRS
jgi:hypothetical protein